MALLHTYDSLKAQVFISYTSDDRALAVNFIELLCDDAIKAGASIWYDRHLLPAREWDREILGRLQEADVVLMLASPRYLQSTYCMQREVPLVRARQKVGGCAVRLVRLRDFGAIETTFKEFTSWPDGGTAQEYGAKSPQMTALRIWLKVEICKALVARNSDRYRFNTRQEELADREANPERALWPGYDNLNFLHQELGKPFISRARLVGGVGSSIVIGLAGGIGIKQFFFPGPLHWWLEAVLLFAAIGILAGSIKPVFRDLELWAEARAQGEVHYFALRGFDFVGALIGPLSGAIQCAVFGMVAGLVLAFGWSFDPGVAGTAVIAAFFCFNAGLDFARTFAAKRLQVFTDVRHVYVPPPGVEPLPSLRERLFAELEARTQERIAALKRSAASSDTTIHAQSAAETIAAGTPTGVTVRPVTEEQPEQKRLRSVEDVPLRLTIVASSARANDVTALKAALKAERCGDIFRTEIFLDTDSRGADTSFWQAVMRWPGYCLVLMTSELAASPVPGAIARALSQQPFTGEHKLYPVLVDRLPTGSPLMNIQGLPTGQIPVAEWSIRENAWTNVCRELLVDAVDGFFYRLNDVLEALRVEKLRSEGRDAWDLVRGLGNREELVDPRHDLAHFPFKHLRVYWSTRRAILWTLVGAICFELVRPVAAAGAVFLVAVAYLGLRDTLTYLQARVWLFREGKLTVFDFLTETGMVNQPERRPILLRTAKVLVLPFCLVLVVIPTIAVSGIGQSSLHLWASGALVGLLCYVLSRYRVPAVTARRESPTPHSTRLIRRGWKWTFGLPSEASGLSARSRIGKAASPLPELIEGHRYQASLSAWMLVRALLDTLWLAPLGLGVWLTAYRAGIHPVAGLVFSVYFICVLLHCLHMRPKPTYFGDEPKWRTWWRTYRYQVFGPALRSMRAYAIVFVATLAAWHLLPRSDAWVLALSLAVGAVAVTFLKRLHHQFVESIGHLEQGDGR